MTTLQQVRFRIPTDDESGGRRSTAVSLADSQLLIPATNQPYRTARWLRSRRRFVRLFRRLFV